MAYRAQVTIPAYEGPFERSVKADSFIRQGITSSTSANSAVLLAITWSSMCADSPVDARKPRSLLHKFLDALEANYIETISSFSSLWDDISSSVYHNDVSLTLTDDMVNKAKQTPIFREILKLGRSWNPDLFRFVTTFLLYGKKVIYEDKNLDDTALRGWHQVEERLAKLQDLRTDGLKPIIRWMLRGFSDDFFLPIHGGGSVAEGTRSVSEKNRLITHLPSIKYLFEDRDAIQDVHSAFPRVSNTHATMSNLRRSRLLFVPKDIKKSRSICMEPATLQWAQQGVRLWLEQAIKTGPVSANIPLSDQSVNRTFAQYGSLTGKIDTIDLSSASDSVKLDLVRAIFPPKVLMYLLGTRSTTVELPNGEEFSPVKFAPMGSALCFPVQSLVYSAVVIREGILWRLGEDSWSADYDPSIDLIDTLFKISFASTLSKGDDKVLEPFTVFGDDIITDHRITSRTISSLMSLGFQVNTDKSFTGEVAFRESCGGYYLRGVDVTPLRFKGIVCDKVTGKTSPLSVAGLIAHANQLRDYGYLHARKHVLRYVLYGDHDGIHKYAGMNQILFSSDPDSSFAIYHPRPHNKHLKLRMWDGEVGVPRSPSETHHLYQRIEVRSADLVAKPKKSLSWIHEDYLYTAWMRGKYNESRGIPFRIPGRDPWDSRKALQERALTEALSRTDTIKMVVRWRWTPTA